MNEPDFTMNDWLRPLIKACLQEVLAELGQTASPKLYSPEEGAKRLSVPKRWLYEKAAAGLIPCQHIGKYLRFTDADLLEIARNSSSQKFVYISRHASGGKPDAKRQG